MCLFHPIYFLNTLYTKIYNVLSIVQHTSDDDDCRRGNNACPIVSFEKPKSTPKRAETHSSQECVKEPSSQNTGTPSVSLEKPAQSSSTPKRAETQSSQELKTLQENQKVLLAKVQVIHENQKVMQENQKVLLDKVEQILRLQESNRQVLDGTVNFRANFAKVKTLNTVHTSQI